LQQQLQTNKPWSGGEIKFANHCHFLFVSALLILRNGFQLQIIIILNFRDRAFCNLYNFGFKFKQHLLF